MEIALAEDPDQISRFAYSRRHIFCKRPDEEFKMSLLDRTKMVLGTTLISLGGAAGTVTNI